MATTAERFWAKVRKTETCWLWTGAVTGQGKYGYFHVGMVDGRKRATQSHRWSYENCVGPIPDGAEVDHLCRVRLCVRPEHLEPVTHAENHKRRVGTKTGPYNVGATCRSGHLRTSTTTGVNAQGSRFCRPCARAAQARSALKKRQQ